MQKKKKTTLTQQKIAELTIFERKTHIYHWVKSAALESLYGSVHHTQCDELAMQDPSR